MSVRRWLAGGILGVALTTSLASAQTGYLHAVGTSIVDGSNQPVQLKGVNLGNWLFMEPWMWGTFAFGSYMDGEGEKDKLGDYLAANLTAAQTQTFWQKYRSNYVTSQDIQQIKSYGWNCVRVPFDYRLFLDKATGNLTTDNFVYLDNLLSWCQSAGVYAILDMHNVPGSAYSWNNNNCYSSSANLALYTKAWKAIASRYATHPAVAGYDLVNEPVSSGDSRLRDMQIAATNAIRQVDTNHLVFAEGDYYASQLDILGAPWDSNMGFSDHNYASTLPNNLPHDQDLATRYNIPLWMGEYGYNSNDWIYQQMQLLNAVNTVNSRTIQSHWTLWSWKANAIWSPVGYGSYGAFQKVLDSVNNNTALSPAQVYAGLLDLTNVVSLRNNRVNRDVVDAMTRASFGTTASPSANLIVPGVFRAAQYDFGREGVAYHDTLSSNTGGMGSGFQSWNSGWNTRNDGVDLGLWRDTSVKSKSVVPVQRPVLGWNDAGEWVQYTANVAPGNYQLQFKSSGPGGDLHVEVNGANVTGTVHLPPSPGGDWGTFANFTVPGVTLTAFGQVPLRIVCEKAGYNLESFTFIAAPTAPNGQTIAVLAESNNAYVAVSGSTLVSSLSAPTGAASLTLIPAGPGLFVLQNASNGKYVGLGQGSTLDPTVATPGAAARFRWVGLGGNRFHLFCETNQQYVCADQSLGSPPVLAANRSVPQGWESFQFSSIVAKRPKPTKQ